MGHFTKNHHQLTIYIHGVVGVLGTGDQSGNGCFYEQENAVTQFPESRTYLATLRHGDMERVGMCIVVLNVVIGLLVGLFFQVVLRGRVVFMGVCQMPIKNNLAHYV